MTFKGPSQLKLFYYSMKDQTIENWKKRWTKQILNYFLQKNVYDKKHRREKQFKGFQIFNCLRIVLSYHLITLFPPTSLQSLLLWHHWTQGQEFILNSAPSNNEVSCLHQSLHKTHFLLAQLTEARACWRGWTVTILEWSLRKRP